MKNILVVGATGNLGPHLVKAFAQNGHHVSALVRPATMSNTDKVEPLKALGIRLISGDLNDQASLERACEGQDVVVSAVGGEQIMMQPALAEAAVKAGVERFIPSEFGVDPHTAGKGSCDLFDAKAIAQEQIKATGIPTTMVYSNGFMEFWASGLGQLGPGSPPEQVQLFGDGQTSATMTSLGDIAKYTAAVIEDPSTLNKEVSISPNKITQSELIDLWESLSGKSVERIPVSRQEVDAIIDQSNTPEAMMTRIFTQLHRSVWLSGDTDKNRPGVIEAVSKYSAISPVTPRDFLGNFL